MDWRVNFIWSLMAVKSYVSFILIFLLVKLLGLMFQFWLVLVYFSWGLYLKFKFNWVGWQVTIWVNHFFMGDFLFLMCWEDCFDLGLSMVMFEFDLIQRDWLDEVIVWFKLRFFVKDWLGLVNFSYGFWVILWVRVFRFIFGWWWNDCLNLLLYWWATHGFKLSYLQWVKWFWVIQVSGQLSSNSLYSFKVMHYWLGQTWWVRNK